MEKRQKETERSSIDSRERIITGYRILDQNARVYKSLDKALTKVKEKQLRKFQKELKLQQLPWEQRNQAVDTPYVGHQQSRKILC
jgi:hypothetical protein